MILNELIDFVGEYGELEITGISHNHNTVQIGEIYFCFSEDKNQAKSCVLTALKNGAVVAYSKFNFNLLRTIKIKNVRGEFAKACYNFYGRACDDLKIIGITGTNGKTTTSYIIGEMLKRNGKKVGIIGTSGVFYNGKTFDCPLTTPDADFLHKTFKDMRDDGVEYVIMEVSAHAIQQKRIEGIKFEIGVITNITQDHLDYFKTFENYENVKLSFFKKKFMKKAVLCADDCSVKKLFNTIKIPYKTYGLNNPADTFGIDIYCSINGSHFVANVYDSVVEIKTNLVGNYNVYNALAGLTVCKMLGLSDKELALGLNFINPVEGRFNVINVDGKYVVIDFAHSPDSLMNVLSVARKLTEKRVFVVFGCGGNRDKTKRAKMGEIAEKLADFVCLTDDNPRLENSLDIITDIEKGMKKNHFVEIDRKKAIKKMISLAMPGDIVIIAGKGAEKYQEIGSIKYPYNDFDVIFSIVNNNNESEELS